MKAGEDCRAVRTGARNPVLQRRGWRREREKCCCAGGPTVVQLHVQPQAQGLATPLLRSGGGLVSGSLERKSHEGVRHMLLFCEAFKTVPFHLRSFPACFPRNFFISLFLLFFFLLILSMKLLSSVQVFTLDSLCPGDKEPIFSCIHKNLVTAMPSHLNMPGRRRILMWFCLDSSWKETEKAIAGA